MTIEKKTIDTIITVATDNPDQVEITENDDGKLLTFKQYKILNEEDYNKLDNRIAIEIMQYYFSVKYQEDRIHISLEERMFGGQTLIDWVAMGTPFEYVIWADNVEEFKRFTDLLVYIKDSHEKAKETKTNDILDKMSSKQLTFENPISVILKRQTEKKKTKKFSLHGNSQPELIDFIDVDNPEIFDEEELEHDEEDMD